MYAYWVLIMNIDRLKHGNCASLRCGQQSTTQFSRDHLRQLHKRWHIIVSNNTIRCTYALPSTLNSNWKIFCISFPGPHASHAAIYSYYLKCCLLSTIKVLFIDHILMWYCARAMCITSNAKKQHLQFSISKKNQHFASQINFPLFDIFWYFLSCFYNYVQLLCIINLCFCKTGWEEGVL